MISLQKRVTEKLIDSILAIEKRCMLIHIYAMKSMLNYFFILQRFYGNEYIVANRHDKGYWKLSGNNYLFKILFLCKKGTTVCILHGIDIITA